MNYIVSLIFILINAPMLLSAQDNSSYYVFGDPYKATVLGLPHRSPDSLRAFALFRISYETLQFQKTVRNGMEAFSAETEVNIAFRDSTGVTKGRFLWKDTVVAYDFGETTMKNKWVEGAVEIDLPLQNYSVELEFDSKSRYRVNTIDLDIDPSQRYGLTNKQVSILFTENNIDDPLILDPFIAGNKILFNPNGALINIFTRVNELSDQYFFVCNALSSSIDVESNELDSELSFSGKPVVDRPRPFSLVRDRDFIVLKEDMSAVEVSDHVSFHIEFPANKLKPGRYSIKIFDELGKDTLSVDFDVNWEDMPQSLVKIDDAVDYMYYILDDERYENWQSLRPSEREIAFNSYWETIDPTPNTPFNEALYQYFSRVDYAFFNYRTIVQKDGGKTDRGKIYILYGDPTSREEKFVDEESVIVWRYENLGKEFQFRAVATGVYKLTAINEI